MKAKAFSIVEIILAVCVFIIIAAVIIPLNMSDTPQAERIAKWHKVYHELEYSFKLLKLQEGSMLGDSPYQLSENEQFERIKPYLDVPTRGKSVSLSKYKYKYRNNTFVKKTSKYYFQNFFWMNNNVIASYKKNVDFESGENPPLAYMFLDINGLEKPNRIGLDIFFINIYNDKISAYGDEYPIAKLRAGCSKIGKGLFCSKYYLIGGNI